MAIDKDSNFWIQVKKVIQAQNVLSDVQDTSSPNLNDATEAIIEAYDVVRQDYIDADGLIGDNESINSFLNTSKLTYKEYADNAIRSLVEEEDYPANLEGNLDAILSQVNTDMSSAGHFILENAVTLTPTSGASNVGNGTIHVDSTDATETELQYLRNEVVTLECTTDGQLGGTAGQEVFEIRGELAYPPEDNREGGSGVGPSVTVASGNTLLDNGDFENFTSNAPNQWTIEAGTAGTEIKENTTQKQFGDACLEFVGTGTGPKISQALDSELQKETKYLLSAYVKTSGVAAGTITIQIAGVAGLNAISISSSYPTGSWTRYNAIIYLPNSVPTGTTLDIQTNNSLTATGRVFIEDVVLTPYVEHYGVFYAITRGVNDFVTKDKWLVTNTNDRAGNLNTYFGDYYNFQFRTSGAGANTVTDTL
jgi:hypothetical protein